MNGQTRKPCLLCPAHFICIRRVALDHASGDTLRRCSCPACLSSQRGNDAREGRSKISVLKSDPVLIFSPRQGRDTLPAFSERWPANSLEPDQTGKLRSFFFNTTAINPMKPRPCCSHQTPGVPDPVPGPWCQLSELLEITISSLCSVVTWVYTVQNELPQSHQGVSFRRRRQSVMESLLTGS